MVSSTSGQVKSPLHHGVELFNRCAFFECHEAWEEIWMRERGPLRLFLQSLIHIAVGLHHYRRGNPSGAERQLRKGLKKLAGYLPEFGGIDTECLYQQTSDCLALILTEETIREFPKIRFR